MSVFRIMLMVSFLFALTMAHLSVSLAMVEHTIRILVFMVFSLRARGSR
jgi:hypothetical protein